MHKELKHNTNKRKCKKHNDLQVNILQIVFLFTVLEKYQNTLVVINIC